MPREQRLQPQRPLALARDPHRALLDRSREANATDYDDVLIAMTDDGSMPVDAQQRDTLLRAEANGVPPVPVEQIYDYSVMQEATRELRAAGYRPNR